ncbi:dienelactone hydrolase family protein [Tahibacter soli]|uniref:Dienelactone hydrolase family protein n=1 Tax=Tahibacter soli TaxID=2983605 RepID=A0A9X4BLP7_9GAMM|nr:dienelactone hydrolase family protein [Tahibacter soli]MDC8015582.1 dienelactone hydrolase family protein [Tahibacter soli]
MKSAAFLFAFAALALAGNAHAAVVTNKIEYDVDGAKMQSVLVYDDAGAKRPGLVMAPNWMGLGEDQVSKAATIAGKDYVILVADVYGVGNWPKNPDEAGKATEKMYKERNVLRKRINAALDQLKKQAGGAPLDGKNWGAIGFCFGGATALDLARSGADVAGVATFHANLASDDVTMAKNIKGKVLVMNGGDDKFVSPESIQTFEKEMRDAKVDWQFINYGGAVHCFAEPDEQGRIPGCLYNERAAKRSFAQMRAFFADVFKP